MFSSNLIVFTDRHRWRDEKSVWNTKKSFGKRHPHCPRLLETLITATWRCIYESLWTTFVTDMVCFVFLEVKCFLHWLWFFLSCFHADFANDLTSSLFLKSGNVYRDPWGILLVFAKYVKIDSSLISGKIRMMRLRKAWDLVRFSGKRFHSSGFEIDILLSLCQRSSRKDSVIASCQLVDHSKDSFSYLNFALKLNKDKDKAKIERECTINMKTLSCN